MRIRPDSSAVWPRWLALGLLAAALATLATLSWRQAGGRLLYSYDDAWIQLAIAKNFALHGVFGVTPHAFTSASSSPLWCLLLAGLFTLGGVHEHLPLLLNALAAGGVLVLVDRLLRHERVAAGWRAITLLVTLVVTPLAGLAFVGMEHSLHALLNLAFLVAAARELADGDGTPPARWWLPALAAVLPLTRYEGFAALALVAGLLLLRRRPLRAAVVASCGLAPVIVFGLWSRAEGWHFLPNSVLLKAGLLGHRDLAALLPLRPVDIDRLWRHPALLTLLVASSLLLVRRLDRDRSLWRLPSLLLLATAALCLAQERYGALGFLLRYDAYLLVLGIPALAVVLLADATPPLVALRRHSALAIAGGALLGALLLAPFASRARLGIIETVWGGADREIEHVVPAEWVGDHLRGETVVANDIGALAYYGEGRVLDLVGLASREPLAAGQDGGPFTASDVEAWAEREDARLAITTAPWPEIQRLIPARWVRIAVIELPEDVVYRGKRVFLHACRPEEAATLRHLVAADLAPRLAALGARVELR